MRAASNATSVKPALIDRRMHLAYHIFRTTLQFDEGAALATWDRGGEPQRRLSFDAEPRLEFPAAQAAALRVSHTCVVPPSCRFSVLRNSNITQHSTAKGGKPRKPGAGIWKIFQLCPMEKMYNQRAPAQ